MTDRANSVPAVVEPAAAPADKGGFKAWLPLLFTIAAMPALAYAATTFLIVPQIKQAVGGAMVTSASPASGHAAGSGGPGASAVRQSVALNKMVVNVAGTMGTRYLLTSVTLVGDAADFKAVVEANRDQLLDIAMGTLSNKTISELESPGARNQIRTELLNGFNQVLANGVREIYITEFAIQ